MGRPVIDSNVSAALPATAPGASSTHESDSRCCSCARDASGYRFEGHTTAVEDGEAWGISYALTVDADWVTRSAHITGRSALGVRDVRLEGDGTGRWRVDDEPAPSSMDAWRSISRRLPSRTLYRSTGSDFG
jgi:hypothetical protein